MRIFLFVLACVFCLSFNCATRNQHVKSANPYELSVAFYNIENLFDTINQKSHNDDDFTPDGRFNWNSYKYSRKMSRLQSVIDTLDNGSAPDVLGVCEIENLLVFNDLMDSSQLKKSYHLIHFDSEDERGIDVALALNKSKLTPLETKKIKVQLTKDKKDRTRDIIYVKAKSTIYNDTFNFFVCHFPSRREGKQESEQNRLDAAFALKNFISEHLSKNSNTIIMGDFNDQPWDKSLTVGLGAFSQKKCGDCNFINLMFELPASTGSYKYKGNWERIDQMILSKSLLDGHCSEYIDGSLFIPTYDFLIQKGKYKGYPLRTFGGNNWLDGYSDHLPVCIKIAIEQCPEKKD